MSFSDFNWNRNPSRKNLWDAFQIQYLVEKVPAQAQDDVPIVRIQAINILNEDRRSLPPQGFDIEFFDMLKFASSKQWMLALTWESRRTLLPPPSIQLLECYIIYYEKIWDELMEDGNISPMRVWLKTELCFNGFHKHTGTGTYTEGQLDEGLEDIFQYIKSGDPWKMGKAFYDIPDFGKMEKVEMDRAFESVAQWLLAHQEDP